MKTTLSIYRLFQIIIGVISLLFVFCSVFFLSRYQDEDIHPLLQARWSNPTWKSKLPTSKWNRLFSAMPTSSLPTLYYYDPLMEGSLQLISEAKSALASLSSFTSFSETTNHHQSRFPLPHPSLLQVLTRLEAERKVKLVYTSDPSVFSTLNGFFQGTSEECGTWQKPYADFHALEMAKDNPRMAIYECREGQNCGGLADRVLGMISTFFFALMTDRAFGMYWEQPCPLESLFEAPNINWTVPTRLKHIPPTIVSFNKNKTIIDTLYPHNQSWSEIYLDQVVTIKSNRGIVIRSLVNHTEYRKKATKMGLRTHTAIGCLLDFLLQPYPHVFLYINMYIQLLTLPSVFSVGLQIRTGDEAFNPLRRSTLSDNELLQQYLPFLNCAMELVDNYRHPTQVVVFFLVSDSARLRRVIQEAYPKEVILTSLDPEHIQPHQKSFPASSPVSDENARDHVKNNLTASENAIAENYILASCDFKIVSPGGFGKLAAYHGKKTQSTILLTPRGNNIFLRRLAAKYELQCADEKVFSSFPEMADEWSLG